MVTQTAEQWITKKCRPCEGGHGKTHPAPRPRSTCSSLSGWRLSQDWAAAREALARAGFHGRHPLLRQDRRTGRKRRPSSRPSSGGISATCGSSCGRTPWADCRRTTSSWPPRSTNCRSKGGRRADEGAGAGGVSLRMGRRKDEGERMKKPPDCGGGYGGAKPQADIPAIANIDILPPSALRLPPPTNPAPLSPNRMAGIPRPIGLRRAAETDFHRGRDGDAVQDVRRANGHTRRRRRLPAARRSNRSSDTSRPGRTAWRSGCPRSCRVPRSS